jgi:hypothetical protein
MPNNVHGIFLVGAASTATTSRTLQWQEEALIELVDDGGDPGGLRVVDHHIYMCPVLL